MTNKFVILVIILLCNYMQCDKKPEKNGINEQALPYFRRRVEEILDDNTLTQSDETHSKLVSVLIDNVNEIFKDNEEKADGLVTRGIIGSKTTTKIQDSNGSYSEFSIIFRPTVALNNDSITAQTLLPMNRVNLFEPVDSYNLNTTTITEMVTLKTKKGKKYLTFHTASKLPTAVTNADEEKVHLLHAIKYNSNLPQINNLITKEAASKDLLLIEGEETLKKHNKTMHKDVSTFTTLPSILITTPKQPGLDHTMKRSCIMCDNVAEADCGSPKNTLIPSTVCEHEDSLCYSQHTPFGIVDRGCMSISYNMTIYVCSCNLCNSVSISDMPIIFASKQEWIANVYDLSHEKRLKRSIFKEMSCLRCETNITGGSEKPESLNCLEGRITSLNIQRCPESEICAVKAIKSQGYIWRGCVRSPLYNYYMTLCDSDLCNYNPIVSVYDPV